MGSLLEINDTLQITTEQGFPDHIFNLERHLKDPITLDEVDGMEFEAPVPLMNDPVVPNPVRGASYDITLDGLLLTSDDRAGLPMAGDRWSLVVTTNWFDAVRERSPEPR